MKTKAGWAIIKKNICSLIDESGIPIPASSSGGVRGIGFKYMAKQQRL
jgi:hypothetical protein